jgi:hypothetical protein
VTIGLDTEMSDIGSGRATAVGRAASLLDAASAMRASRAIITALSEAGAPPSMAAFTGAAASLRGLCLPPSDDASRSDVPLSSRWPGATESGAVEELATPPTQAVEPTSSALTTSGSVFTDLKDKRIEELDDSAELHSFYSVEPVNWPHHTTR